MGDSRGQGGDGHSRGFASRENRRRQEGQLGTISTSSADGSSSLLGNRDRRRGSTGVPELSTPISADSDGLPHGCRHCLGRIPVSIALAIAVLVLVVAIAVAILVLVVGLSPLAEYVEYAIE